MPAVAPSLANTTTIAMYPFSYRSTLFLLLAALCVGGCYAQQDEDEPFMRLAVGSRWIYRTTAANGRTAFDTISIPGDTAIKGKRWYRIASSTSEIRPGTLYTMREDGLYAVVPGVESPAIGLRIMARSPRLTDTIIDEREARDWFKSGHAERVQTLVTTLDDQQVVPAGTFSCMRVVMRLQRLDPASGRINAQPNAELDYARGVGLVKHVEYDAQGRLKATRELMSYKP